MRKTQLSAQTLAHYCDKCSRNYEYTINFTISKKYDEEYLFFDRLTGWTQKKWNFSKLQKFLVTQKTQKTQITTGSSKQHFVLFPADSSNFFEQSKYGFYLNSMLIACLKRNCTSKIHLPNTCPLCRGHICKQLHVLHFPSSDVTNEISHNSIAIWRHNCYPQFIDCMIRH